MAPQLSPHEASREARDALAAAGFTGLHIDSFVSSMAYVTTRVRVNAGTADRVLAILRRLPRPGPSGRGGDGVWINRWR
jgi:hypothetical protein